MLLSSAITIYGASQIPTSNDASKRARRIARHVHNDDLVISVGLYRWFLVYEWHPMGFAAEVRSFPPMHDRQLCWQYAEEELEHPEVIQKGINEVLGYIEAALSEQRTVWILFNGDVKGPRWQVDSQFFDALLKKGLRLEPVDEWLGLGRVTR